MSLVGYKPDESILTGGEGVPIAPNQAGGGGVDTSALDSGTFNQSDEEAIKSAFAASFFIVSQVPGVTHEQMLDAATTAANTQAIKILNDRARADEDSFLLYENTTKAERLAAETAVRLKSNQDDVKEKLLNNPTKAIEELQKVAIDAIIKQREADKPTKAVPANVTVPTTMITEFANDIVNLATITVFTEFYHLTDENVDTSKFKNIVASKFREIRDPVANKKMKLDMFADVEKYKAHRLKQWDSVYRVTDKKVSPIIPVIQDTGRAPNDIITQFSRFIYCVPYTHDKIVVVPPINGDINLFVKVLYRLTKIGAMVYKKVGGKDTYKVKTGITIVFMPSFYAKFTEADATEVNFLLFSIFIDMHKRNPNNLFILSENSSNNYLVGSMLASIFTTRNLFRNIPLTMLEPSYIAYPYKRLGLQDGFIISASMPSESNIPESRINNYGLTQLKTNKLYGNAVGLSVTSYDPKVSGSPGTFTIQANANAVASQKALEYDLSHPPGPCDGLLKSDSLDKISRDSTGNIFYLNSFNIKKGTDQAKNDKAVMVIQLNANGDHKPLCTSALENAALSMEHDDKHVASDSAVRSENLSQIDIKGNIFSIRVPEDKNSDKITSDWKNKIFTKDEADFLNSTRLRPAVLEGVFGEVWPIELSNFLYTFVRSKCMADTDLLTNAECYSCRKFLEKIHVYFINNSLQMNLKEEKEEHANLEKYAEKLEKDIPTVIDPFHARETNEQERVLRKTQFQTINSYKHTDIGASEPSERRALIIGVHRRTGQYKFYIITVPYSKNQSEDDAALLKLATQDLPKRYEDYIFIY